MNTAETQHAHGGLAFDRTVQARRSVRAFRPDPVPHELLAHIFTLAARAPSNCNTQPWLTMVASGACCERLRAGIFEACSQGQFSMDFPYEGRYTGVYRERQFDAADQLYRPMGIERADKPARGAAFMRNFSFFSAPHVAFLFLPDWAGIRESADLGMYAQTLMLAFAAHGLASCPQTALSFAADLVREELGVAAEYKLLFGMSFGYEASGDPANRCRIPRADLAAGARFVD